MKTINEYRLFDENISAYIDNELDMELSLKIKKFLIKSKYAKIDFARTNKVINLVKSDIEGYSKSIAKKERFRNFIISIKKFLSKS